MALSSLNEWEQEGELSKSVSIGTHNLFLFAAGPARVPDLPVVIIIQGLGSHSSSWSAVSRLLSATHRVYRYDRSGFGLSDPSPHPPTALNIALELDLLLQAADIKPPYILIGHSWGGVLSREFTARKKESIVGLVLVEANQENTIDVLDWRKLLNWAMEAKIDFSKLPNLENKNKLTSEEWKKFQDDASNEKFKEWAAKEWDEYGGSFEELRKKNQLHQTPPFLGDRAISVVKGKNADELKYMYDAVLETGYGSEEEKAFFKDFMRTFDEKDLVLQKGALSLSSIGRFVEVGKSGHNVQLTEPEVIVEEAKWVYEQYEASLK